MKISFLDGVFGNHIPLNPAYDVIRIDLSESWHEEAFLHGYESMLRPNFASFELLPQDIMLEGLKADETSPQYVVFMAGRHLERDDREVLGFAIGNYYPEIASGFLTYNVIAPELRSNGLGKKLVDARLGVFEDMAMAQGQTLKNVYVEANDPENTLDDVMDPKARIQKYMRGGAKLIPFNYYSSPLESHEDGIPYKLLCYPEYTGKNPDFLDVKALLDTLYRCDQKHSGYSLSLQSLMALSLSLVQNEHNQNSVGAMVGSVPVVGLEYFEKPLP